MEIIGSFILSILHSILFYGKEIGISCVLFFTIGNGIIYYILYKKNKIQNKAGILLMIPILLLSSTYFIFANSTFYIANIFILIILNLIMYIILTNKKNYFKNYLYNSVELLANTISEYGDSAKYTKEFSEGLIQRKNKINKDFIKKIALSFLTVFIVVGIVIMLLASADSIFASLFSGLNILFYSINFESAFSFLLRILLIIIVYLFILSLILNLKKEYVLEERELNQINDKHIYTIKLLLVALNIVYLVFCFIQIFSLFAKVNIDENFDYSNYARTGFFQLMFVSFINFIVILVSNRYNENKGNMIKLLNLSLVVFTIIIALSSMYRMYMYEIEYGLTYLRTFVYIILVTEIMAFIPVALYIFNKNFDFIKWCFIILICNYCIINYMNIETIIVNKNVNRISSTKQIDYDYISSIISADSYEILENKLRNENISNTEKLDILNLLTKLATTTQDLSWQEFNISKYNLKKRNIDVQELELEINKTRNEIVEENRINAIKNKNYIYNEVINSNETYLVEQVDSVMSTAVWKISKLTDNEKNYSIINTIEVTTPSKIKFFENGLGFIEKPSSVYCEKSDLLITHDSGKTFEKIDFPDGVFTLSNPERE